MSIETASVQSPEKRPKGRPVRPVLLAFFAFFIAFWLYGYIVVRPRGIAYTQALQTLRPEAVRAVCLRVVPYDSMRPLEERRLDREEIAEFLKLISKAKPYSTGNRPQSLWFSPVEVEIEVVDRPRFKFSISSTDVAGVLFGLSSDNWHYGTLRNDDLGPFIDGRLRAQRRAPPPKNSAT